MIWSSVERWSSLALVMALSMGATACRDDAVGAGATDDAGSSDETGLTPPTTTPTPDSTTDDSETSDGSSSESGEEETGDPGCASDDECDDGNACTASSCGNDGECTAPAPVASNDCRPQIEVDFPPRAATLADASPVVTVTGRVTSGAGPIAWLELGGENVELEADGSFSHDITAVTGGNTLVFETEDVFETPRKRVQSFLWSSSYRLPTTPDVGIADEALGIYLDQETLDDGSRTPPPDDLATLIAMAVDTIDIAQFVPAGSIYSQAGYDVYITDVDYTSSSAALSGIDGGVHMRAALNAIDGDLLFDCVGDGLPCFNLDQTGGFTATSISATADLIVSVSGDNELAVTPTNVQSQVTGLNLTADNQVVDFLLDFVEPFIISGIVADIESQLEGQITSTLGPALSQALTGLEPDSTLVFPNLADAKDPIEVQLTTDYFSTDFHDGNAPPPPQGGVIVLRGGGYPVEVVTPHENLGVPTRAACGAGGGGITLPRAGALEIGLHDDLLNQLLNGAWRGGLLEFQMPDELLGPDSDLISDLEIHISGMLAPTASDCGADGVVRAHLGDVRIEGSLLLNDAPVTFVAYSSMIANLDFSTTDSGVAVTIADVEEIETEMTVAEDDSLDAELVLVPALETQLVDGLIDAIAQGGLGEINLPVIDLSASLGLPAGTAQIEVSTQSVSREPGTTVITGRL